MIVLDKDQQNQLNNAAPIIRDMYAGLQNNNNNNNNSNNNAMNDNNNNNSNTQPAMTEQQQMEGQQHKKILQRSSKNAGSLSPFFFDFFDFSFVTFEGFVSAL